MSNRIKLELTRPGKHNEIALEPRILIEKPELSNNGEWSDNLLIHGDNLLALKALEQDYAGQVKCIYIDPPYNTGNAFEHYDDGLEHSQWLSLMKPRLELLKSLLSDDGVIFISIDDDEYHYLKILCDEVFGRWNYSWSFIREKKKKPSFLSNMWSITEYILSYAKDKLKSPPFIYWETTKWKKYPFNNAWNWLAKLNFKAWSVSFQLNDQKIEPQDMSEGAIKTKLLTQLIIENGKNKNDFILEWERRYSQRKLDEIIKNNEWISISKIPFRPNHIKEWWEPKKAKNLLSIAHYWMSTYEDSTKETINLFWNSKAFDYPKPEMLLNFLVWSVTNPWDLVLDSFLWSWTTGAVAHKMGRRWIGIELWDHAYTHAKVRMDKVIAGEQWGISKAVERKGGWSYKFLELWPSLLTQDQYGQRIINKELDGNKLIQALCKIENYSYCYDDDGIKHGRSSEASFLHVTTRHINQAIIDDIAKAHIWSNEWLLILSRTYDNGIQLPPNIRLKKIPKSILSKCEYGRSDYNLPVTEQDISEDEDELE